MKYLRTEDNRILKYGEQADKGFDKGIFEIHNIDNNAFAPYNSIKVLKEADTIEDLCDEFVIVGTNWQQIIDLESAKYNNEKHERLKIYGAIWTDKGLIYVAKMNNKGVLELI